MRPTLGRADADSHLWPCPQCGSANGLNAHACWSCDAVLAPPDDSGLPAPISAALDAQGMRVPEILAEKAEGAAEGAQVEPRPAPSAGRRNLFEAAVARMNGESDDPSDGWGEWQPTAEPDRSPDAAGSDEAAPSEVPNGEPSTADRSTGGRSGLDRWTSEPWGSERWTSEPWTSEPSTSEGSPFERSASEQSTAEPSAADTSAAEPSITDPTTAELPAFGESTTDSSITGTSIDTSAVEPPAESRTAELPTAEEAYAVEVQAALRLADSLHDEVLHDGGPRAELPPSDVPVTEGPHAEDENIATAALEDPAVPSFADTPFDETRFSIKSFDSWQPADSPTGSGTRDPDASNEGSFPERTEATAADPPASDTAAFVQGVAEPRAAADGMVADPVDAGPPAAPDGTVADPVDADLHAATDRMVAGPVDANLRAAPDGTVADPVDADLGAATDRMVADSVNGAHPDSAVGADPLAASEFLAGADVLTARETPAEAASTASQTLLRAATDRLPGSAADLAAALTPIDEPLPARWQPKGAPHGRADPFPAFATVAESESTTPKSAAASVWPKPPFVVSSDPPFEMPKDLPVAGTPSIPGSADFLNELPPTSTDPLSTPSRSDPPTAKRRSMRRSREESALQTFEDSFFAAGTHPSIHSDDDASFDSGRSGLGSTQPPVRGGRDVDSFGPLPSARAERESEPFRDEALGEKFAALASTSAQAARRRKRVTIASLCLVAVVGVLAAYPFFGNGVRIDLSSEELRSATSMSTTPLAPAPVARMPETPRLPTDEGSANRTAPRAAALTPPAPPPAATTRPAPARVAGNDAGPAPTGQASGSQARPGRVPREVAERLVRRQGPAARTSADATVAPTTDRARPDGNRPNTETAGPRPQADRLGATDGPPTDVQANRRRAGDEPAAESGSITCTERILALNLCGPPTRKE